MSRELKSVERGDDGLTDAPRVAPGADIRAQVIRVPVDSLQPNPMNGLLYRESLREDLLGALAESLRDDGQREPMKVDAANVILDGERRWRALRIIGARFADVIVDPTARTPADVEDYILDSYSLKRRASFYERINIFEALVRSYTRRHGRPPGRPKKSDMNVAGYWAPTRIREKAARDAGFTSRETARRAQAVIRSDSDQLKARLEAAEITIDAAYRLLVGNETRRNGRQRAAAAETTPEAPEVEAPDSEQGVSPTLAAGELARIDGSKAGHAAGFSEDSMVLQSPEAPVAAPSAGRDTTWLESPDEPASAQCEAPHPAVDAVDDDLDLGFDLDEVELGDLLLAVCRKLELVAGSSDAEVPYYVDMAVDRIRAAQRKASAEGSD